MAYKSTYTGFEIDRAIGTVRKREKVWDNKQEKLTGEPGQVVGFDQRGNAVAKDQTDGGAAPAKTVEITLRADGWNDLVQHVYIEGILEQEDAQLIQPIPAAISLNDYIGSEIRAAQSLNQLIFTCVTPPVVDIQLFVVIENLKAGY